MTDSEIDYYIKTRKLVFDAPPKNYRIAGAQRRKDFKVKSDEGFIYTVFIRQNLEFQENFSIGLLLHFEGKKIMLFRANGNHGEVVENPQRPSPHFGFHYHKLTAHDFEIGKYFDPKFSQKTDGYNSFEEAIIFFIKFTNIEDGLLHFPNINQLPLFQD